MNENKPKIEIIPALLPDDFNQLEEEIFQVKKAIKESAGYVQIDVVDGKFAPTETWPYNKSDQKEWELLKKQERGLPFWENVDFEIDLMVMDQLGSARDWINAGVRRVIGHIESFDQNSTDEIEQFLKLKEEFGVEIVLSLNPSTDNLILEPYLDRIDAVQFMGNDKIGYHGVELDEKVLPKIADLREKKPNLPIGIDIGVNFKTLRKLADAGVTRFSSGSTILNSEDPRQTILDMIDVIEKQ